MVAYLWANKGIVITFVIFMSVFGTHGLWVAGIVCFLHFAIFVMPRKWR